MFTKKAFCTAFAAAGVLALSACATTGDESASTGRYGGQEAPARSPAVEGQLTS